MVRKVWENPATTYNHRALSTHVHTCTTNSHPHTEQKWSLIVHHSHCLPIPSRSPAILAPRPALTCKAVLWNGLLELWPAHWASSLDLVFLWLCCWSWVTLDNFFLFLGLSVPTNDLKRLNSVSSFKVDPENPAFSVNVGWQTDL